MTTHSTLADRYVHAATRHLAEDQRDDVADELRGSITDRVEAMHHERPGIEAAEAERATLVELGDPDRLSAGYSGSSLHLIGPEIYPAYIRVLRSLLITAVPAAAIVVTAIDAADGDSIGTALRAGAWMAFIVATQVAVWVTVAFALAERRQGSQDPRGSLGTGWTPDQLPQLPRGRRGSVGELATNLAWLGFLGVVVVAQHPDLPLHDSGRRLPLLDPDLWSFWLPLILALLVVEVGFEVVKYSAGGWTPRLASINVVTGALLSAPWVYLAASDQLLNPAAVAKIQEGSPGFDPGSASTLVIVVTLAIWVWDGVSGWRRSRSG